MPKPRSQEHRDAIAEMLLENAESSVGLMYHGEGDGNGIPDSELILFWESLQGLITKRHSILSEMVKEAQL